MTRSSSFLAACTVAALATLPCAASAQESSGFGRGDRFVVSIDNLAGVVHQRVKVGDGDTNKTTHIGSLGTLGPYSNFFSPGAPPLTRLGFHYFVDPSISIGSGLYYNDTDNLGTTIVLAPRVGFAFPAGDSTSFWLRAGVTYSRWKWDLFGETTFTNLMPAVDALFVLSPVEHFSFTLGGTAEIGVYGKEKQKVSSFGTGVTIAENEEDVKTTQFGLVFGALASF